MQDRHEEYAQDYLHAGDVWEIDNGWDVFAADGEKVGNVEEIHPQYLVVGKGFFFHTERYVPVSAIADVEHARVYLNVSSSEYEHQGWEQIPDLAASEDDTTFDDGPVGGTDRLVKNDYLHVPLVEEELDVQTRDVERGSVHVHKDVVEEVQTIDVPLHEEQLRVERHRVERDSGADEVSADAFQDMEIEIPIRGEEIDVSKRAVVREKVDISKVVQERDRQFSDTVRREELHVDNERDPVEHDERPS